MATEEIARKCKKCDKPAEFEVSGHSAQFGAPLSTYHCKEHIPVAGSHPKIMEYNKFTELIRPIGTEDWNDLKAWQRAKS